tara:strand:+ start:8537 stop:9574 length:1038 start_codon:yes stop_codon:yes gene_type:complete
MKITAKPIYFILIVLILGIGTCNGQDFFKYATIYASGNVNTSMIENQDYIAVNKGYEETTQINPYDINFTVGIRRIAFFDFEQKKTTWYTGSETSVADNTTISFYNGWEYLANYSFIRNRSETFTNSDFWLRYLSNKSVTKIQVKNDEARNLEYISFDSRFRVNKGGFDFTIGMIGRHHPVYLNSMPIEDFWQSGESSFQELAEDFGYSTQFVQGQWHWFNDSELIATSNDEFFKHYFGSAIAQYNQNQLSALGSVSELSVAIGTSYYYYTKDFWLLSWVNVMPYHYGLDEYSYEYEGVPTDVDLGLVAGWKITKNLGVFVEGTYLEYWEKPVYEWKFGFNYLIF